jgi:glycine/D-amino acid oxidase-like deaminating enzyme
VHRRGILKLLSCQLIASACGGAAKHDRVVIVGAGIIGASIGYHLAQRGARVTILEKQRPGAGATEKSFAWINANPSKRPRSYYELNVLGMVGWRRLWGEFGSDLQMQWGGSVRWFPAGVQADRLRAEVAGHEQWGYATHLIEASDVTRLLPAIDSGPVATACFSEQEGTVDPVQALGAYIKHARQSGATIEYPCEVTGITRSGSRVNGIQTTRGAIEADFLVLAAGVDTPRLARMVDVNVPLKESTGILAHTSPCTRLLDRVALAPGADIKQNPDGRIVTGMDFGASGTKEASREYGMELLHHADRFVVRLKDAKLETVTLGHRVLPQDDHPIVGFSERCPNLYIAAMHSGITLSPLIGQLAAAEILDGITVDLLVPYRPTRFA